MKYFVFTLRAITCEAALYCSLIDEYDLLFYYPASKNTVFILFCVTRIKKMFQLK